MTDQERKQRLLARFKDDLLKLALSEPYRDEGGVVIIGLEDVSEALERRAVRADPPLLPEILQRIDKKRENVRRVGESVDDDDPVRH